MISTKVLIRCVIVLLVVLLSLLYGNSISVQRLREEIRFIAGYRNTYDFSIDYFAPTLITGVLISKTIRVSRVFSIWRLGYLKEALLYGFSKIF
jgi:hypothetical protein